MFPWLALGAIISALVSSSCSDSHSNNEAPLETSEESKPSEEPKPSESPSNEVPVPPPSTLESETEGPCPKGMTQIDRFCVDT